MIIPIKDNYIDVIRNGDDSVHKKVVLHYDGTFTIEKNDSFDIDSEYVGRSETLDAGNDYVGIAASEDQEYINKSFAMFLKAWYNYKKNGRTNQYLDIYGPETEEDLVKAIMELE